MLVLGLAITGIVLYFVYCHKKEEKKLKKAQLAKIHED